jgi:hypothetical protein
MTLENLERFPFLVRIVRVDYKKEVYITEKKTEIKFKDFEYLKEYLLNAEGITAVGRKYFMSRSAIGRHLKEVSIKLGYGCHSLLRVDVCRRQVEKIEEYIANI